MLTHTIPFVYEKGCASILTQPFVFGFGIYSDSYSNNLKKKRRL